MSQRTSEMLSLWTARVNEVEENGYEIRRYCIEHKLREKSYYSWRRKIRDINNAADGFTKLSFSSSESSKGLSAGFKVLFESGNWADI